MKFLIPLMAGAALIVPMAVSAQTSSAPSLSGLHIGADAVRDANETRQPGSGRDASRSGYGARAHVGYDAIVGPLFVGAEVGVGSGGRTVDQASIGGGRFRVNPGLTYDFTARAGFAVDQGLAVYGRAGYRWLRTEQTISGQTTGNVSQRLTERGLTYGVGAEVAVAEGFSVRAEFNHTNFSKELRQNRISIGASLRF